MDEPYRAGNFSTGTPPDNVKAHLVGLLQRRYEFFD
jgi:hypothetical protein